MRNGEDGVEVCVILKMEYIGIEVRDRHDNEC